MDQKQKGIDLVNKFATRFSARATLAITIIVAALASYFIPFFVEIPKTNENHVSIGQGFLWGLAGAVIQWYFGSSKNKDDQEKAQQVKTLIQEAKDNVS
ncbi:MAG TPA: hypothetical protein VD794_05445 [Flavisolibacter sp.]|nr:hypothetical protein [Flavisolibacter sp.]